MNTPLYAIPGQRAALAETAAVTSASSATAVDADPLSRARSVAEVLALLR